MCYFVILRVAGLFGLFLVVSVCLYGERLKYGGWKGLEGNNERAK